eukprot:946272-Prorocentrum_minimum.AAC.9
MSTPPTVCPSILLRGCRHPTKRGSSRFATRGPRTAQRAGALNVQSVAHGSDGDGLLARHHAVHRVARRGGVVAACSHPRGPRQVSRGARKVLSRGALAATELASRESTRLSTPLPHWSAAIARSHHCN